MSFDRLWIVTPVLLDVEPFLLLRERVRGVLERDAGLRDALVSFVVIDDSAGLDQSIGRLRALDDVAVIEPPFQLGHQRAIVHGLRKIAPWTADEDVVVTMDADGEDRPEDLPRLLEPLIGAEGEAGIVLALRTRRRTSLPFKLLYVGFRILFRLLTGTGVRTGNYAAYPAAVAKRLLLHPLFDLSYSSTFGALGVPVHYVPCERAERYAGESRMGYAKLLLHGVRMLMPFVDRIAVRALVVFAVTLALGLGLAIAVVGVKLFTDEAIPGWTTYTLLGTLIVSLVSLGNFVTLFTIVSQARATSLANIEQFENERSRVAPTATD